jgi:3-oxoacyl-(acyl-carrier-protein) synthase
LNGLRIFITSMGIVSPFGEGIEKNLSTLREAVPALTPLQLFPSAHVPLPVGEIPFPIPHGNLPRTHVLAMMAAEEALKEAGGPPDAVVVGTTTGGMTATEEYLKQGEKDPVLYRHHAAGSVAEAIAARFGCRGPVLTVSTACSSGTAALKIALELLRSGKARRALAGGADALCRLTYYGFHSLQLVDPGGAHPFDSGRKGMSVGEGAAMFLLTAAAAPPDGAVAELLGGALTCDAHHPAAPHPSGEGARQAMKKALADAGVLREEIDYIHLHGTGTPENDLAEGRAVRALFDGRSVPPASSLKGAWGHSLAAAGAMGAAVSALAVREGFIPPNVGIQTPDPEIPLSPMDAFQTTDVRQVLVNSFGFGGNNAVLVLGHAGNGKGPVRVRENGESIPFYVHGRSCLTGAGDTDRTLDMLSRGENLKGMVPSSDMSKHLPAKAVRRLKRLSRMVLSLGISACAGKREGNLPRAIFFGTRWGALSETHDFLAKLFETDERLSSPTDFIGSVHNAPAGQAAIHFHAPGPNITITGCNGSFEQALFSAGLLCGEDPFLLVGADEYNEHLSPLFDPEASSAERATDGGGALYLKRKKEGATSRVAPVFTGFADAGESVIRKLIAELGGAARIRERFGLILSGIPASFREQAKRQEETFLAGTDYPHPLVDYRRFVGECASASAVATVLAVLFVEKGMVPAGLCGRTPADLGGRGILILGFGRHVTALEVTPC